MANNTYNGAAAQAQSGGNALVKKLQENNFALVQGVKDALLTQGVPESELPQLAATCMVMGISPNLMRYPHNIPQVIRARDLVAQYGYRVGEDFYVSVFSSDQKITNEYGEPTDQKAKAPTIVVMPSAARAIQNMKDDDRMCGVIHHVEAEVVEDRVRAEVLFKTYAGENKVWCDEAMVAVAYLYTYLKNGQPMGSGKPQLFYGFFAPKYIHQGSTKVDYNEMGKPKDNYGPGDVAMKRAMTKAARHVTRSNYARDTRPVDVRLASLIEHAKTQLQLVEQHALLGDGDFDTAFEAASNGDALTEQPGADSPVLDKGFLQDEAGDILFAAPTPAKKAKAAPPVEPAAVETVAASVKDEPVAAVEAAMAVPEEEAVWTHLVDENGEIQFSATPILEFISSVIVRMTPEMSVFSDLLVHGPKDADVDRTGQDDEMSNEQWNRLIAKVNDACGFTDADTHIGMRLGEITLRLLAAQDEGTPSMAFAFALNAAITQQDRKGKASPFFDPKALALVKQLGTMVKEMSADG